MLTLRLKETQHGQHTELYELAESHAMPTESNETKDTWIEQTLTNNNCILRVAVEPVFILKAY
jgi:hypothetical protein